jgi:hypothetical protein
LPRVFPNVKAPWQKTFIFGLLGYLLPRGYFWVPIRYHGEEGKNNMDISENGMPIGASLPWISTLSNMTCKCIRTFCPVLYILAGFRFSKPPPSFTWWVPSGYHTHTHNIYIYIYIYMTQGFRYSKSPWPQALPVRLVIVTVKA